MHAIGIDIGGTAIKLGVVKDGCEVIRRAVSPTDKSPEAAAQTIARMVREAMADHPNAPVGMGCAGWVLDGVISADNLQWYGVPLGPMLERELGVRVPSANDAHLAMLAEWRYGALVGHDHAVYLTLGTGVGGGLIVNGQPYRGHLNTGSELGHMITHADGLKCACGQQGCFEMYASASALSKLAGGMPARKVIEAARTGGMQKVWHAYLAEICVGLVSLMSIFAPTAVALGGGVSGAGSLLLDGVRAQLDRTPGYQRLHGDVRVDLARFGNDAGVIGAAALAAMSAETNP